MATSTEVPADDLLDLLRNGPLTEAQAREIVAQGPEVAVFAILELSKRLAEQQARTVQQAVEAQRKLAEQFASSPEQFTAPFGPEFARPFDVNFDNIEKHHEAIRNMMEERHNSFARIADPFRPDFAGRETLRDDRRPQAESQREEMMKRVEEQRKASQERHATLRQRFEERRINREI